MAYLVYEDNFSFDVPLLSYLQFDATITEVHAQKATMTEHPIERGAAITDHVVPSMRKLSMEARVTNTPLPYGEPPSLAAHTAASTFPLEVGQVNHAPNTLQLTSSYYRWAKAAGVKGGSSWTDVVPLRVPGIPRPYTPPTVVPAERAEVQQTVAAQYVSPVGRTDRVRAIWVALQALCASGSICTVVTDLEGYESMVLVDVSAPREAADAITFSLDFAQARFAVFGAAQEARVAPRPSEPRARPVVAASTEPQAPVDLELELERQRTYFSLLYEGGIKAFLP